VDNKFSLEILLESLLYFHVCQILLCTCHTNDI